LPKLLLFDPHYITPNP